MNNNLISNLFTDSTDISNIFKLNYSSLNIFESSLSKIFEKNNSLLLNKKSKIFFLFQILQINIRNNKKIYLLSNFKNDWNKLKKKDRLTKEYKKIYTKILNFNNKNKIDFKKYQNIKNLCDDDYNFLSNKLSSYFLTAKDALYILSNRIEINKKSTINSIIDKYNIKNDILVYNEIYDDSKETSLLSYNLCKYLSMIEIITACDHIFLLKDLKNKYQKFSKIFIFENFNFDDYNIIQEKELVNDYFDSNNFYTGHSGLMCLNFNEKKLILFDPDGLEINKISYLFNNKIKYLFKLAFNEDWFIEILDFKTEYFNNSIQEFYCNFHSNYNYCCTFISSLFGLLYSIFPLLNPKEIYFLLIFKTKVINNKLKIIRTNNKNIFGGRQLLVWINNLINLLK